MSTLQLDGESLSPEVLYRLGHCTENGKPTIQVVLSTASIARIKEGRRVIDEIIAKGDIVYGVNTGFGLFSKVTVSEDKLARLQENLIRSHAVGVGKPLSRDLSRMVMALRINVLCKGHSGIRLETVERYVKALNKNCIPCIPEKGTVGASGDLAPLSHLALGCMGEGDMWNPKGLLFPAKDVLEQNGLQKIRLTAKEGLALINGTQFITAIGVEALVRAKQLALAADVTAAITLEALKGTATAYFPLIHRARPHSGQMEVAERMSKLLGSPNNPSEIAESHKDCGRVQDAYTLRCVPQVHGITHDTLKFVEGILSTECNSATDNPMIFSANAMNDPLLPKDRVISGGNFHGEYPAKACDYLAIGLAEIGNISERRVERLCNPDLSGLPAFLVKDGGLNSGFMIAHCTAAALASENKVLCHPASVDSLSTSAAKEDHVSMGGFAARKALSVVENVESILAVELLAACQGLDLLRPLKSTPALERVHSVVRKVVKFYDADRYFKPDIDAAKKLLRQDRVWEAVSEFVERQEQTATSVSKKRKRDS